MPLERRNPLPIGRYAVTLLGPTQQQRFALWRAENRDTVAVRSAQLSTSHNPSAEFVTFDVLFDGAVRWDGPGFPDRVSEDVTSFEDFEQSPVTPDPLNAFLAQSEQLQKAWPWLLIGAAVLVWQSQKRRWY